MFSRKIALTFAAGLTLAGCNLAPKYVRPELPVAPSTPTGPAYAATDAAGAIVPADTAWEAFFTDDRLRRVIRTALDNNRDVRIAVANVAQARAQYRVQRADQRGLPRAGGTGDDEQGGWRGHHASNRWQVVVSTPWMRRAVRAIRRLAFAGANLSLRRRSAMREAGR